ncbi:MAG: hypothetical protein BWY51_00668 [Parcubacteria group bacterium ADurb.Bin316]|nr:MAG: hypothetical protein BWY51_00668 [Parcubacteria group bacterium ADurb.Bin316]HOZ56201.1 hypothetical protein [bacterium]
MIELFNTPVSSWIIIVLTITYTVTSAITTFDIRLIQAKKSGALHPDEPMLPGWVGIIAWFHWGIFISIVLLNWKYAILVFVIKFILKVLPVLEILGNILMSPFKIKK